MKLFFIYNPNAGASKKQPLKKKQVYQSLDTEKRKWKKTKRQGHAVTIAQKLKNKNVAVIAIGGDGTVNEVGSQLIKGEAALGIIPRGSGNGLAREVGIPLEVDKATEFLNHSEVHTIDTLSINDKFALNVAGIGFDAEVAHVFDQLKGRGFITYIKATFQVIKKFVPLTIEIETEDSKVTEKIFLCSLANSRQFGNNAYISPNAVLNDGKMNLCMIRPFPIWYAPVLALRLFTKSIHKSGYYSEIVCEKAIIRSAEPMRVHIDGEPVEMEGPINVNVNPSSLKVLGKPVE